MAGCVGRNSEFTLVAHHVLYTLCFVLQRQHVHHIYMCVCMYDGGEVHVCYNSTESQPKSINSACNVPKNTYIHTYIHTYIRTYIHT